MRSRKSSSTFLQRRRLPSGFETLEIYRMHEKYKQVIIIGWAWILTAMVNGRLACEPVFQRDYLRSNVRRPGQSYFGLHQNSIGSILSRCMLLCKEKTPSPFVIYCGMLRRSVWMHNKSFSKFPRFNLHYGNFYDFHVIRERWGHNDYGFLQQIFPDADRARRNS